jgi:hypothetical protein
MTFPNDVGESTCKLPLELSWVYGGNKGFTSECKPIIIAWKGNLGKKRNVKRPIKIKRLKKWHMWNDIKCKRMWPGMNWP